MLIQSSLHRRTQRVGVGPWTEIDWRSGLVAVYNPSNLDNGTATMPDGRGVVLRHKAGTTTLGANANPRQGVGVFFPIDLPVPLNFYRHTILVRGIIDISSDDGRQAGEASGIMLAADNYSTLATFQYSYGGMRVVAGPAITHTCRNGSGSTDGSNAPAANRWKYIRLETAVPRLAGTGSAPGSTASTVGDSFSEDDLGQVGGNTVRSFLNQAQWGANNTHRVYVGAWAHTVGNTLASAFEVTIERIGYRVIDQEPEW